MFYKHVGQNLIEWCATYVDDTIRAATKKYNEYCKSNEKWFTCKLRKWDSINFAGLSSSSHKDEYIIHQKEYIYRLKPFRAFNNVFNFRQANPAWATNSRPFIDFHVAILTQVTIDQFQTDKKYFVKKFIGIVKR